MNICSGQCKYIIAIYELGMLKNNKPVRSIDIAQHLGVTRPSVSKMLKRMSCNGFIEEDCSQKVILTAEGLETAKGLYYRYRMLYMFFRRVLHESKENAKSQAVLFLSTFSSDTSEKLSEVMEKNLERSRARRQQTLSA